MVLEYYFDKDIFENPSFGIKTEQYWMLIDLRNLAKEAMIEVVKKLDTVLNGDLQEYEFGHDYTIIDFRKETSVIHYDFFENQKEIESEALYQLMRDWRDYLLEYSKATDNDV